jgi:N-acetylmuramoyl-L-alanine amidase
VARPEPPVAIPLATVPAATAPAATVSAGTVPVTPSASAAAAAAIVEAPPPPPAANTPPPLTPSANARGGFSLSRQLGLGIARIVIDAGHGGHDPGASVKGLSEADLTLDVALRLEKLLLRQPGVEVIQTRRTNAFVPLEERTDLANRSGADIFLSIHANASSDRRARGVETYFLNFAPTAEAEALAARENAASTRAMRQLPEIVRAIALNNKLDESRDLARLVQEALFAQVRKSDRRARNLGVKQAPFMALVGAQMPSILTEISFLTNQQDAGLLATEKYRQQIAEALLAGITRYQQTLKKAPSVATQ